MKKLILIFTMVIFILPIKGQEKIDIIKIDCNCMQEDTLISFNLNGNWHIQIVPKLQPDSIIIREILLQDLIDYQKECYDDSVLVSFETISHWKLDSLLTSKFKIPCYVAIDSLTGIYAHPHHPTFEEFIEFMKNKINENNSR